MAEKAVEDEIPKKEEASAPVLSKALATPDVVNHRDREGDGDGEGMEGRDQRRDQRGSDPVLTPFSSPFFSLAVESGRTAVGRTKQRLSKRISRASWQWH
jgi:hypothetical protein